MDYEKVCDISAKAPPGPENPLPEYGELAEKRHTKQSNRLRTSAYETAMSEKRKTCLKNPMKPQCIPEDIILPSKPLPESAGKYMEVDPPSASALGQFLKGVRIGKSKVDFPGWLVELTNPQLQSVVDAKDLLATGKPLCELADPFYQAIMGLESGITIGEVKEILKRVPLTGKGWSFSHFMFIAGNPNFAKKKGVLQDPFLLSDGKDHCKDKEAEEKTVPPSRAQSKVQVSKSKSRREIVNRLYQLPKVTEDPYPPKADKQASGDESGYSLREQLFYSGLLYCEMYDTMQELGKMYTQAGNIPEPREKLIKRQQQTGFGISDIGTRKLGFAEWDRPLPPLPKVSPYITDFPVVGFQKKIIKPTGIAYMHRRSVTKFNPFYLAITAPKKEKPKDTIKVLSDSSRVKGILNLMASQGNCLALLPNVTSIFYLSDALLQKMDVVRPKDWKQPPVIHRSNERDYITKLAKNLFRPHGLPPQIAKIPQLITFTDGLKLREICKQVREQHWSYICVRKTQFREGIWPLMHVDRIPCGNLRESFVYSFQTLLPAKSHFPILRSDAFPW